MKTNIIVIILFLITFECKSQNYYNSRINIRNSWGDYAYSLISDNQDIYVAFATFLNGELIPPWSTGLMHLDQFGNILDTTFISIPFTNVYPGGPGSISKTDSGYVIGGSCADSINASALLMHFDFNGNLIYTNHYGDSGIFTSSWMAKKINGNYFFCGETHDTILNTSVGYLSKVDVEGNILWKQIYSSIGWPTRTMSFINTSDSGFALAGLRINPGPTNSIYLAKTDSLGVLQWDTAYKGPWSSNQIWSITNTNDGNFVIAGLYGIGNQSTSPYFAKFDLLGNILWEKIFLVDTPLPTNRFYSIRELSDGSFIAAGNYNPPGPPAIRGMLMKISSSGDSIWMNSYFNEPNSNHELTDVYPTPDGGFIACGTIVIIPPDTGHQDLWILKVDSVGCEIANCTIGIGDIIKEKNFSVYPNPFTSNFNLEAPFEKYTVELYNELGKKVFSKNYSAKKQIIETNELSEGIYFLSILSNSQRVFSKKVLCIK